MRILILSPEFPPFQIGGVGQHVSDLSKALVNEKVETHVMTYKPINKPYKLSEYEEIKGISVHRVSVLNLKVPNPYIGIVQFNIHLLQKIVSFVKEVGLPDLIHAHDWNVILAGIAASEIYNLPLVCTIHSTVKSLGGTEMIETPIGKYITDIQQEGIRNAQKVICCSYAMAQELNELFHIMRGKIEIIPNGIHIEEFTNISKNVISDLYSRLTEEGQKKVILFVGRLDSVKGVDIIIKAIKLLNIPSIRLVIAGDGPLKKVYVNLAKGSDIIFLGFQKRYELLKLYKCASLVVMPSTYESFGIVALESMAAKVPLIASSVGGLAEIIQDGYNGILVPPNDIHKLAEAISIVLNNIELRQKLIYNGFNTVINKYNWLNIASRTIEVYKKVLSSINRK
ncbi:glycosyltransferase family 4 protein [bacterium]|nr:glycosyltransferase family 4 protein [bacterium]